MTSYPPLTMLHLSPSHATLHLVFLTLSTAIPSSLPSCTVKPLQMVHNAVMHLVFNQLKRVHVTPMFIEKFPILSLRSTLLCSCNPWSLTTSTVQSSLACSYYRCGNYPFFLTYEARHKDGYLVISLVTYVDGILNKVDARLRDPPATNNSIWLYLFLDPLALKWRWRVQS